MKKCFVFLFVSLLILPCVNDTYAIGKKKKKKKAAIELPAKKELPKKSKYEKLFDRPSHIVAKGDFLTLHKVDGKLYFEMPIKYMNREMLLASTASETSSNSFSLNGYKPNAPMHIKFSLKDSTVYMHQINAVPHIQMSEPRTKLLKEQNFIDPILETYKVEAYNPDSSAIVFNMTNLFTSNDEKLTPVLKSGGAVRLTAVPKAGGTRLDEIKAFDDNVTIKTWYCFSVSEKLLGKFSMSQEEPLTVRATRTLLLLPENKMRPRISDSRIGIFLTPKRLITNDEDQLRTYTLANRWRLEPTNVEAYRRGELVTPVKPITFYLDNAFPESWRAPLKEGVLRWNKAFEKIGFKNVIQVLDFPKNDPNFDPDNLKYSCIRYIPSSVANAMGPSWVDPTTGEIINASVIIYNNISQLINEWRFVQTAQIDPRVRTKKMPDDIMYESIAYVVAHEVGHCLGLMHNMAASAAVPVDSLRSATYTQQYGTTPSIMDYARFNYVAQPNDNGVRLTPPNLGVYDEYAIKWLYSYFPNEKDAFSEAKILENWVDEKAGDPRYRYGKQQIMSRYDPSAIEEDLGNDPLKAGEYGTKNLKYILAHLNEWITDDGDLSHRRMLLNGIMNQYGRYFMNILSNVGGIYLSEVKDGTPGKSFEAVPLKTQKASLKWTIDQVKNSDWLRCPEISDKLSFHVSLDATFRYVAAQAIMGRATNVLLSANATPKSYSIANYLDDLYNYVWESTLQNRKATNGDIALQTEMINSILSAIAPAPAPMPGLFGITSPAQQSLLPSIFEIYLYGLDESGFVQQYFQELTELENNYGKGYVATNLDLDKFKQGYGWQPRLNTDAIDNSQIYYYALVGKLKSLLRSRSTSAPDQTTQNHYKAMLYKLEQLDKK